jgi:phage gp36-like protein
MAYATPADLISRKDRNDVGQLCGDDKRVVSPVDLTTNQPCLDALADASGDIEAALLVGNRYTVADLTTLTGNSLALLKRICCDIAMSLLLDRRPGWNPAKSKEIRDLANDRLERLRKGENTFNIQASLDAGEPVVDGPTMMEYDRLNLIRDRVKNFYVPRHNPNNR